MNKLVEWEVTLKCNYDCDYCGLLRPIKEITDEDVLRKFIKTLNETYHETELFLFGGEPFLHPKIEFIINTLQEFNQPFVIQTNLSNASSKVISALNTKKFKFYCSVHVSQTDLFDVCKNIVSCKPDQIHLMYTEDTGKVELWYKAINIIKGNSKLILTPVSNLACKGYDEVLKKYDDIKEKYIYDDNIIEYDGTEALRSDIWLKQNAESKSLTKGKPCMYSGRYFLYTPNLELMNCCYRKQTKGICDEQNCFFM